MKMDPYLNLSWFWFSPFENIIGKPIKVALYIINPQQKQGRTRMIRLWSAIRPSKKPKNRPTLMKIESLSFNYLETADHPLIYPKYHQYYHRQSWLWPKTHRILSVHFAQFYRFPQLKCRKQPQYSKGQ